jgi:putative DNA primase/helicase
VSLIPVIRQSIKVFTKAAAEHFDSQRLGDQYGTLLAGAWSLMSSNVPSPDEAKQLINMNTWEAYSQATEVPDEQRCIQRILQHQVRVEADEKTCTRTLGELVEVVSHQSTDMDVTSRQAQETLGRYGLRVDKEDGLLMVSNTAEALAGILRDSPWSHSWPTVLSRLQGASKMGAVRFRGAGAVSRAVALQISAL